jgi:hypothetical protein
LQITAVVTGMAHRVATQDAAVAEHGWLSQATDYCLAAIDAMGPDPHALALAFAVQFLDLVHDHRPEASGLLNGLGERIPANGMVHVDGGLEDEMMRPLDFAPLPDRPARELFDRDTIAAELERLADRQEDDGGWRVDFASYSPAASLEWRGHMTVNALSILKRNSVMLQKPLAHRPRRTAELVVGGRNRVEEALDERRQQRGRRVLAVHERSSSQHRGGILRRRRGYFARGGVKSRRRADDSGIMKEAASAGLLAPS